MAEAVKVIVRCRPMNERESGLGCRDAIAIDERLAQCSISNPVDKNKAQPKSFTFDGAYGIDSTTQQIYAEIGFPLVEGVTEGYNGTIFAYGQTGSGKSFSMQGLNDPSLQKGIIPRAFDHVFEKVQVSEGVKYLIHASYLEIYNEEIRDLLGTDIKQKLELKEHPEKGVYIPGLSMHLCKNVRECEKVMSRGWKNRSTGATLMNADSSRSHSIFTIHMERAETDDQGEDHIRVAKLNLVDLAGSERQGKTGATGDRLKEATKINLSLSALGNVISALVDGKSTHIPYRDSKLTRLLQDSLGGNTKTLMVACLSPADNNYEETLSTLRYANRAKNIKNKPKINEDPKDALLREYQDEIKKLKAMLSGQMPKLNEGDSDENRRIKSRTSSRTRNSEIDVEKQKLKEEFEMEMRRMREELSTVRASKDEVEREMKRLRNDYEEKFVEIDKTSQNERFNDAKNENKTKNDSLQSNEHLETTGTTELTLYNERESTEENKEDFKTRSQRKILDDQSRRQSLDLANQDEVIKRLKELEQKMVGGEDAGNEEVKERLRKKKKFADDRNKRLRDALAQMNGEDIMIEIYEDVNEKLKFVEKKLEKEKQKSETLKSEINDIQSEFERDRRDYLDMIRKQEKQTKWLQAVIDRIHPTVRSDCNYVNLDRILSQSKWESNELHWTLPKLTIEKLQLPSPTQNGGEQLGRRGSATNHSRHQELTTGNYADDFRDDSGDIDRYRQKLLSSEEQHIANNYFSKSRAKELLNKDRMHFLSPKNDNYNSPNVLQPVNGFLSSRPSQVSDAAITLLRKPTKLESLTSTSVKHDKKQNYHKRRDN